MPGAIQLPASQDDAGRSQRCHSQGLMIVLAAIGLLGLIACWPLELFDLSASWHDASKDRHMPRCPPQVDPLVPKATFSPDSKDEYAERLSQAVRIPTVSYDDNGKPGEDVSCRPGCMTLR